MSKSFFLLFRETGESSLRIYKTIRTVRKYIAEDPQLKYMEFKSEAEAIAWFEGNILRKVEKREYKQENYKRYSQEPKAILVDQKQIRLYPYENSPHHVKTAKENTKPPIIYYLTKKQSPSKPRPINLDKIPSFLRSYSPEPIVIPENTPIKLYTNFWQKQNPGLTWLSYMLQYHQQQCFRHIMVGQKYRNQAELLPIVYGMWDAYNQNAEELRVSVMSKTHLSILNSPSRQFMDSRINTLLSAIREMEKGFRNIEYECNPEEESLHAQLNIKLINYIKL